ncbi:hypothetical protein Ccar_25950 (plasmid) [Clostridium carboxidivorans P7]|uniref:HTH cro/C1-type domain-containing protein n=1 Tax=Clostridium carboxidivorans P7 TaxID=536227 RepID=C6PZY7_9CLOT|nr:hypothetical protein [Clostridium carboxidivorans]AKN34273.1 hypothetical protein Ccar_25950 [Clostridium carboxidivorans P7]EET85197.1 hypothetical protein CcarbDRAFT_4354 [Clostridium carboxidivorans P7]
MDKSKEMSICDILGRDTSEYKEYVSIDLPKIKISEMLRDAIHSQNLSLRKISKIIDNMNLDDYKASYTQIARVTSGENYNINTLLKILDVLNLEIDIKEKRN